MRIPYAKAISIAFLVAIPLLMITCISLVNQQEPPPYSAYPTVAPTPQPKPISIDNFGARLAVLNAQTKRHQQFGPPPYQVPLPRWTTTFFPLVNEVWIGCNPQLNHRIPTDPAGPFTTHAHPSAGVVCINPADRAAHWNDDQPTDTFLHDYAHIVDGPHHGNADFHDAEFYRILKQVRADWHE